MILFVPPNGCRRAGNGVDGVCGIGGGRLPVFGIADDGKFGLFIIGKPVGLPPPNDVGPDVKGPVVGGPDIRGHTFANADGAGRPDIIFFYPYNCLQRIVIGNGFHLLPSKKIKFCAFRCVNQAEKNAIGDINHCALITPFHSIHTYIYITTFDKGIFDVEHGR